MVTLCHLRVLGRTGGQLTITSNMETGQLVHGGKHAKSGAYGGMRIPRSKIFRDFQIFPDIGRILP